MLSALFATPSYFWAAYVCLAVGVVFLFAMRAGAPVGARLASVAWAPAVALIFIAATLSDLRIGPLRGLWVFALLQIVPVALLVVAWRRDAAARWTRFVLLPLGLFCWAWQLFWGVLGLLGE